MPTDHWPELRPASFPVNQRSEAPPPLLPRSLPNLGWKRDTSRRIRLDLPKGAPFPFPHSPPGSPLHLRPRPPVPDSDSHRSTSTEAGPDGIISPFDLADLPAGTRAGRTTSPGLSTASMAVELSFFTINAQNAGANNPSLVDIIAMSYHHSMVFLLLIETPLSPHSGALLHALRNRVYRIHHHSSNAPF